MERHPERPTVQALVALTGVIRTDEPITTALIDLDAWPRWRFFGYTLIGIDPEDEREVVGSSK